MSFNEKTFKYSIQRFLPTIGYRATTLKSTNDAKNTFRARHKRFARYFSIQTNFPSYRESNTNTARANYFFQCFGRFVTYTRPTKGYQYAFAFPSTFKSFITRNFDAKFLRTYNLAFFFVSKNGKVEFFNYKSFGKKSNRTFRRKAA
jgi:hypothetical protein